MRRRVVVKGILGICAASLWSPGLVRGAASVNVGVQAENVQLGIHIGDLPPLIVVPGTVVYRAPDLPYNYFVYEKQYYLYHEGRWHRSRHHDGPWAVLVADRVPRPLLAVPVDYYNAPPAHWKKHGPPPWAHAKGHEAKRDHGRKHDEEERGHGKDKRHGKQHD
jgi:hypothetical protein